jgi:hypothetical protein
MIVLPELSPFLLPSLVLLLMLGVLMQWLSQVRARRYLRRELDNVIAQLDQLLQQREPVALPLAVKVPPLTVKAPPPTVAEQHIVQVLRSRAANRGERS